MINNFIKCITLFGTFLGMLSNSENNDKNIIDVEKNVTKENLCKEHIEGAIILTLSNSFSNEVVKDREKVKNFYQKIILHMMIVTV